MKCYEIVIFEVQNDDAPVAVTLDSLAASEDDDVTEMSFKNIKENHKSERGMQEPHYFGFCRYFASKLQTLMESAIPNGQPADTGCRFSNLLLMVLLPQTWARRGMRLQGLCSFRPILVVLWMLDGTI